MSIVQALILGALQGLTEFLPVSSSGHLVIARVFMHIEDVPVLFDVLLHMSTLLVVVFVFRSTVLRLLKAFFALIARREVDPADRATIIALLTATVITGVLGLMIETLAPAGNPRLVAILFCVTGLILFLPRWISPPRTSDAGGFRTGLIVGTAQGLGVFPGISRSGITITASLMAGLDRERAGEFAFLVSIPAILGALLLTAKDLDSLSSRIAPAAMTVGVISSFLVGLASLLLLLRLVRSGKLHYFSFYLIPLGVITLAIV